MGFDRGVASVEFEGLTVTIMRDAEGKLFVQLDGPGEGDLDSDGAPMLTICLNEHIVFPHPDEET